MLYSTNTSYVLDTLAPQWIALGWHGIDTLTLYNNSGTQWVMDDFTVPEPSTLALFGVSAVGWMAMRAHRKIIA